MVRCIRLDTDCAAICRLAASYMARGSELSAAMCEACAEVCDACAQECRRMASQARKPTQAGQGARPSAH